MKKITAIILCQVLIISSFGFSISGLVINTNNLSDPPYVPSNPTPADGAVDVYYFYPNFEFDGGDPDGPANIFYRFRIDTDPWIWDSSLLGYYFNCGDLHIKISFDYLSQTFDNYNGILEPNTTYYWGIDVTDGDGNYVESPVWNFTTSEKISDPPSKPIIFAPETIVKGVEYEYSFVSTDPNNDDIYYHVIFRNHHDVFDLGPRPSGDKAVLKYTWDYDSDLYLIVKAIDLNTAQSNYARVDIPNSRNKFYDNFFLQKIIEKYMICFKSIENILI